MMVKQFNSQISKSRQPDLNLQTHTSSTRPFVGVAIATTAAYGYWTTSTNRSSIVLVTATAAAHGSYHQFRLASSS
jgi:hypothetical protein